MGEGEQGATELSESCSQYIGISPESEVQQHGFALLLHGLQIKRVSATRRDAQLQLLPK
jgi:hypothetical protein